MEYEPAEVATEAIEDALIEDEQPGVFEIPQADRVLTVMGVTGAIGQLFNLCPVPHDQMTQSKVNAYVEKLIAMDETKEPQEEESEEETESEEDETAKKKLI